MQALRWGTGACAAVGGAGWVGACLALAALPTGCVKDECLTRPIREWSTFATSLVIVAVVLMAASGLGLTVLALRVSPERSRRLSRGAALTGVVGVGLLVLGSALAALDAPGMDDAMPAFVVPGIVLCVLAAVLIAWLVVRSRLLPVWTGTVLAATAAMALGANEQNDSILLAAPLGAAWTLAGALLLREVNVDRREALRRETAS